MLEQNRVKKMKECGVGFYLFKVTKLLPAIRLWKTECGGAGKTYLGKDVNQIGKLVATSAEKD